MGRTPNFNFPYPEGVEYIDESSISGLANAIDDTLSTMEGMQRPTTITLTLLNNWTEVGDMKAYRMGRFVQIIGEVIYRPTGAVHGNPVPANRRHFATLPVGWRPITRVRTMSVRSDNVSTELYVDTDGKMTFAEPTVRTSTPGYNVNLSWVTAP